MGKELLKKFLKNIFVVLVGKQKHTIHCQTIQTNYFWCIM